MNRRAVLARLGAALAALALPWRSQEARGPYWTGPAVGEGTFTNNLNGPRWGNLYRVIVRATGGEVLYDGAGPIPPLPTEHRQFYIEHYWTVDEQCHPRVVRA